MSSNLGLTIALSELGISQLKSRRSKEIETQRTKRAQDLQQQQEGQNPQNDNKEGWESHFLTQKTFQEQQQQLRRQQHDSFDETSDSDMGNEAIGDVLHNNNDEIVDEDRMIMPFVANNDSDTQSNNYYGEKSEADTDDDHHGDNTKQGRKKGQSDNDEFDNDDEVSLSPPPSMPMLIVDLEKLCGYKPTDHNEIRKITDDLCEALLGTKKEHEKQQDQRKEDNSTIQNKIDTTTSDGETLEKFGDGLSLDYMNRASELFESGIAHHSDTLSYKTSLSTTTSSRTNPYAMIPYPEFLPISIINDVSNTSTGTKNDADTDTDTHVDSATSQPSLISTQRIWKTILHPSDIKVVQHLLNLLAKCSQNLVWKYQMSIEIRHLVKSENQQFNERKQKQELKIWRQKIRPKELEKLYEVRETFEFRLELARNKYDELVKDREERVEKELRRRKENGIGMGGVSGLDWDGKETFAFVDDEFDDQIIEEEDAFTSEGYNDGYEHDDDRSNDGNSSYSDDSTDSEGVQKPLLQAKSQEVAINNISPMERKKRRATASAKRMKRKIEIQTEKARLSELRARVKDARKEEEEVNIMCTTPDENMAFVAVCTLEKKLEKVDTLLEELQEEEWKDQEEGLLDDNDNEIESAGENQVMTDDLSILDQILAMILGSYPPLESSMSEHFDKMKQEHQKIIEEWKKTFGRLPPSFIESAQIENRVDPIQGVDKSISLTSTKVQSDPNLPTVAKSDVSKATTTIGVPDDWDNIDDWDWDWDGPNLSKAPESAVGSQTKNSRPILNSPSTTQISLRPGGKLKYY